MTFVYVYLVPRHQPVLEAHAAVELLREVYGATGLGIAPIIGGLLYGVKDPIPDDIQQTLNIVPWV